MWLYGLGAILLLTRGLADAPSVLTAVATGGAAAAVALLALGVDETKEPFANVYSAAVSLQNVVPGVSQRLLILVVAAVSAGGAFAIDLVQYASFLLLLGSFFVPLFGVLLADWLLAGGAYRERDVFGAPAVRPGQLAAWLAGFALYQWLSPVGPSWWTSIVEHTHPGQGALGGSLPSFAASFGLALALGAAVRLRPARRRRPSSETAPRARKSRRGAADNGREGRCDLYRSTSCTPETGLPGTSASVRPTISAAAGGRAHVPATTSTACSGPTSARCTWTTP